MRNKSHETVIGILRQYVSDWRKREGWSRETAVQAIVDAHNALNGPAATGIIFNPETRDTFERMKVNADRVFRWLDDEGKDNNLLPSNFLPSALAALPVDLRMACVDEILQSIGLATRCIDDVGQDALNVRHHLCKMIKEDSETHQAVADLMGGTDAAALRRAHKELSESIETQTRARRLIESAMKKPRKAA